MLRPILKFGNRTLTALMEILAIVIVVMAIGFGLFMWKVSQGPFSIAFARDYVQEALSSEADEFYVRFDDLVFSWPEFRGPFQLDLKNLKVQKGKREANTLSIKEASVGLSRGALFFGLIRPVSVVIKSPTIELVRTREGRLALSLRGEGQSAEPKAGGEAEDVSRGEELAQIFKDMANHRRGSFLSRLDEFIIRDASLAVRDYQFGLSWYLTDLDFGIAEHPQGVAASIDIDLPGGRERNAGVSIDMVYRKANDDFRAAARIEAVNPYIISRFLPVPDILGGQNLFFNGAVDMTMDTNLVPQYVKFSGTIPEGEVVVPSEFDAPIKLKDITVASEYNGGDETMAISDLSGLINGVAFRGVGSGTFEEGKLRLPIKIGIDKVDLAQIPPLFPKSEHDGEAYEWLGHRLRGGTFTDAEFALELHADRTRNEELQRDEWKLTLPEFKLAFAFDGTEVHYSDTLMPVTNTKGTGMLDLGAEVLEIKGERGVIGDLEGRDVTVKVTDLMHSAKGYVAIEAKVKGAVATALQYIAAHPINMGQEEIGLDPAKIKGTIDAALSVGLPTIKDVPKEEVKVSIDGTLTDLDIPGIVEGLALSGGPLNLKTEEGGFRIKGNAQLAGRDTQMEWHQFFDSAGRPYSMQVKAKIGADRELRNHFGVDLDEYISGTMPVDVTYTHKMDGTSNVDVTGDLNPVRLHIEPFKFVKPVGMPGTVSAKALLKNDVLKELTDIELKSRDISVSGAKISFAPMNGKKADLSKGTLAGATIGKTKMDVSFDVDSNNVMKVTAKGPVFDLGPFLQETESSDYSVAPRPKEKQKAMKISLSADTMLAKNEQKVAKPKVYLETDTDGDITRLEMDGGVGEKKGELLVRFRPDERGVRTFRLESNDAGAVLYTFGLYENLHGGTLLIYGEPKDGSLRGDLYGAMRMENFRVVKAPALASLLSLMSLSGVSQLLGNQGLAFSKLESDYEWRFRPDGNLLIIKNGKTSGSSIGLTFEGVVDRGRKTTDISGTIIPMTEVNSIIAKIPVIGDILGGSTGLIAATYTMKGPTGDPKVMVNPLSVLAPGFLRRILFEGGYESKIPDDPKPKAQDPLTPASGSQKKVEPAKQAVRTAPVGNN